MFPPAVTPSTDINMLSYEELFILLERIATGFPLPDNIIRDVNPYNFMPANLPGKYLVLISYKTIGAKAYLTIFFYPQ